MAYYPNGRGTYGQPNSPFQPQLPYAQHGGYANAQGHNFRRTSSFEAGDDSSPANEEQPSNTYMGSEGGQSGYGTQTQGSAHEQVVGGGYHQTLPLRDSFYSAGPPNGQYQPYHPVPSSPGPVPYNPQQYSQAQVQGQVQPQAQIASRYNVPPPNFNYQAYNPAAYQAAELQRQPSMGPTSPYASSFYNRQNSYDQGPPPPPRPSGSYSAYSTPNVGAYSATSQSPNPQHPGSAPLPPQPAPYSSPPLLPPRRDSHANVNQYGQHYDRQPYRSHEQVNETYGAVVQTPPDDYPSPPTYNTVHERPSFSDRVDRLSSQNTTPAPLAPTPPTHSSFGQSPQRTDTLTRHPQARPLPGPPPESDSDSDYFAQGISRPQPATAADMSYDELMQEIENAVMVGRSPSRPQGTQQRQDATTSDSHDRTGSGLFTNSHLDITPDERHTHTNGQLEATGAGQYVNYAAFSDDSDAEAAAGLAAMQAADEQEAAEEARRRSGSASLFGTLGSQRLNQSTFQPQDHSSSDSDYKMDVGLASGGYDARLSYDDNVRRDNVRRATELEHGHAQRSHNDRLPPRMSSVRSSDLSTGSRSSQTDSYVPMPTPDLGRPLPPIHVDVARVDTSGTGGLTEPSPHPRRLSFEDGDEAALLDNDAEDRSISQSPSKDSLPDLFYHPGLSPQRPLPPPPPEAEDRISNLMPAGTYPTPHLPPMQTQFGQMHYPPTADAYNVTNPTAVPRSTSLASTRSAPKMDPPMRSKTDADRAKVQRQMTLGGRQSSYDSPQTSMGYDLPSIPKKAFAPEKITANHFKKCTEPWALSSITQWLKNVVADYDDLREHALTDVIVSLFSFKVPTMHTTEAEKLGNKVIKAMFQSGVLMKEEEWVKLGPGYMSGVLFQLTGTGCYSPRLHITEGTGKCYSYHCMRTWRRLDLSQQVGAERKTEDWATFYKLKKEDIESHDKKEIERQNILHEIIMTEDGYMAQLDVLRLLYRDQLRSIQPPIIPAKRAETFIREVFGPIDEVKKVNEDFLLGQLKYRQQEQGPWIVGFSDIFREWIRRAKGVYVNYASGFPRANSLVRMESERNIAFRMFLDQARDDKRSNRLAWDTYLKGPITRLQRYGLLLQTVHKNMKTDSEEKMNLQFAIDEVRAVTFECNSKVDEMSKKIELQELASKLQLRKGMEKVELNLDHLGREVIIQGQLLRAGERGLQWVETQAILFDHYLVLAKVVSGRDSAGGLKSERYDVSRLPIPMDLIALESTLDDPVVKSSVKGIGSVTTATTRPQLASSSSAGGRVGSTISGAGPGTISQTTTNDSSANSQTGSNKSMIATTVIDQPSKDEKIMYPFRVKHLGKADVYTLYASSAASRQEWCEAIIGAKTNHAAALFAQNAEPFKLKVLADTAFGYDSLYAGPKPVVIRGTPLDRAIREAEEKYAGQTRPGPVSRAIVNCATVFNQPYGRLMCAVGTDYGVYISEYNNPRGWTRVRDIYYEHGESLLIVPSRSK